MMTSRFVTIASASVVSVLLAVSLVVASIAYFPNNPPIATRITTLTTTRVQATIVTTTINLTYGFTADCSSLLRPPPSLNLPPNSSLKENGTTLIGARAYWNVSFVLGNLSTVYFHGVKFSFNRTQGPIILGAEGKVWNATMLTLSAATYWPKVSGEDGCSTGYFLPQITITFPDGSSVIYNKVHVKVTQIPTYIGSQTRTFINTTFDKPTSNPWLTQHNAPQAGVAYQTDGGQITLYVSKS